MSNSPILEQPVGGDCHGKPTHWWFPYYHLKKANEIKQIRKEVQMAKEICRGCAIRVKCLEYSLVNEPWGIWGGEDEQSRARIRMRRRIDLVRDGCITFPGLGSTNASGSSIAAKFEAIKAGTRKLK